MSSSPSRSSLSLHRLQRQPNLSQHSVLEPSRPLSEEPVGKSAVDVVAGENAARTLVPQAALPLARGLQAPEGVKRRKNPQRRTGSAFIDLPDELLLNVLRRVPSGTRVQLLLTCRRMAALSRDPWSLGLNDCRPEDVGRMRFELSRLATIAGVRRDEADRPVPMTRERLEALYQLSIPDPSEAPSARDRFRDGRQDQPRRSRYTNGKKIAERPAVIEALIKGLPNEPFLLRHAAVRHPGARTALAELVDGSDTKPAYDAAQALVMAAHQHEDIRQLLMTYPDLRKRLVLLETLSEHPDTHDTIVRTLKSKSLFTWPPETLKNICRVAPPVARLVMNTYATAEDGDVHGFLFQFIGVAAPHDARAVDLIRRANEAFSHQEFVSGTRRYAAFVMACEAAAACPTLAAQFAPILAQHPRVAIRFPQRRRWLPHCPQVVEGLVKALMQGNAGSIEVQALADADSDVLERACRDHDPNVLLSKLREVLDDLGAEEIARVAAALPALRQDILQRVGESRSAADVAAIWAVDDDAARDALMDSPFPQCLEARSRCDAERALEAPHDPRHWVVHNHLIGLLHEGSAHIQTLAAVLLPWTRHERGMREALTEALQVLSDRDSEPVVRQALAAAASHARELNALVEQLKSIGRLRSPYPWHWGERPWIGMLTPESQEALCDMVASLRDEGGPDYRKTVRELRRLYTSGTAPIVRASIYMALFRTRDAVPPFGDAAFLQALRQHPVFKALVEELNRDVFDRPASPQALG